MPRIVRRALPGEALRAAHIFISNRIAEADARRARGDKTHGPYSTIAAYCRAHGTEDGSGSYTWEFPSPIIAGDTAYRGFRWQASQPAPYFDEETAQALITSLGQEAVDAATRTVTVWDYDYLFLARQQQRITGEDLDRVLIMPARQYSLVVLQGD